MKAKRKRKRITITRVVGNVGMTLYPGTGEYEVLEETDTHYIIEPFHSTARLKVPKDAARETG